MLINLSNHPSAKWGEKQKQEAIKQYQEIVDMPFPEIAPEAGIEEVLKRAEEYTKKIIGKLGYTNIKTFDTNTNAVHIMGEMTFTHNVVRFLGHNAITCLASTTKRTVNEEANGQKTSVFEFVQFRPYRSEWEIPS
jgi:hypothetical protein